MKTNLIFTLCCAFLFACSNTPKEKAAQTEKSNSEAVGHAEWSKNATIYEVNIRQYTPQGTFNAFGESLPRLKDMGVEILWIMPINPIGEKNRKGTKGSYYSIKDYKGVNPEFGTMTDFKNLVDKAHQMDMKVILDWVANHSAFDNTWTEEHKDWYDLDSLGNLQPPHGTDWWDVTEFNYDKPDMRAAMIDAMKFWVEEANIDGFRCDVAEMVPMDFWKACRDSLTRIKPDIFMLAEGENPELHAAFDMTYAFEFMHLMNGIAKGDNSVSEIDTYLAEQKKKFDPEDYRMYFTSSHDENSWNGTVFERYGKRGVKTYAVLAATIAGMPMVYSGQEAGLDKALSFFEKDSIDWGNYKYQEFYTKLLTLNRDNPALWNGKYGGELMRLHSDTDSTVYAFTRTKDANKVLVICNLSDQPANVNFRNLPEEDFKSLFGNAEYTDLKKGDFEMEPFGYGVFYK